MSTAEVHRDFLESSGAQREEKTWCVNCRYLGHYCEAQRNFDLCVFCEDKKACPVAASAARKGAPVVAEQPKPPKPPKSPKSPQSSAVLRSPQKKEKSMSMRQGTKCKKADCQTITNTEHGYCPKHYHLSTLQNPEMFGRRCSVEGCTGKIRSDNKSGICKACVRAGAKRAPVQRRTAKLKDYIAGLSNGRAAVPPTSQTTATICVTEGALNQWWGKQSIQSKADIFSLAMAEEEEISVE